MNRKPLWRRIGGLSLTAALALAVFPSCNRGDEPGPAASAPAARSTSVPAVSADVLRATFVRAAQESAVDQTHRLSPDPANPSLYHAYNPHQRMTAALSTSGVRVTHGPDDHPYNTSFKLVRVGCSDSDGGGLGDGAPTVAVSGNRINIKHPTVTEWYVNGPLGIEQGFDLAAPPSCRSGSAGGKVEVELRVDSPLAAELVSEEGHQSVRWKSGKQLLLEYSDLFVQDADGKRLPAAMFLEGTRLTLRVDDQAAKYPIAIDPLIGVAKAEIIPYRNPAAPVSDEEAGARFGTAVAIDGAVAVGGSPNKTEGGLSNAGAVYVYEGSVTGGYAFVQKITAPTPSKGGLFGTSVAVSGNILIVGEPATGSGGSGPGKAYVYVKGTTWPTTPSFTFTPTATADGTGFGTSVDVDGRTFIVGSPNELVGGVALGKTYIFDDTNSDGTFANYSFQMTPLASPVVLVPTAGDTYGYAVSVRGNLALVGAPNSNPGTLKKAGSAELLSAVSAAGLDKVWSYSVSVLSTAAAAGNQFGFSVDVSPKRAIIGSPGEQVLKPADGAAYAYAISGLTIVKEERMSRGVANDKNGFSVSLSDSVDGALVGAFFATSPTGKANVGSAYIFDRNKADPSIPVTMWGFSDDTGSTDVPSPYPEAANDQFGYSVGVTGNIGVVGAPGRTLAVGANEGAIYLYTIVKQQGDACTADIQCATGFCIDGVCCNTVCGRITPGVDNDMDCQVCSMAKGATTDGTCAPKAMGSSCGDTSTTTCTSPDTCDAAGVCQPNNKMDGTACGDTVTNTTCDKPDSCLAGVCNPNYSPTTTQCGAAGADPTCDPADFCDGKGLCAPNLAAFSTPCGNQTKTACHDPDICNGLGTCLTNNRPLGSVCAPAGTGVDATCDPADTCDGKGTCVTNVATDGTACGNTVTNTTCDKPDSCLAGRCNPNYASTATQCAPAGTDATCDPPDFCNGSGLCAPNLAPLGTSCGTTTATACSDPDTCNGLGTCLPNDRPAGTLCASAGANPICDPPDVCNSSGTCVRNIAPAGTVCKAADPLALCDADDTCNELGVCTEKFKPFDSTTPCRAAAGPCDVAEYCTGSYAACPPDQLAPSGKTCRAAASECDAVEQCDGVSASCPADASLPDNSRCSGGLCQGGVCQNQSDLAITITASPNPSSGIDPISFVVQVENRGPAPAKDISVTLAVPPNTTIKSLSGDGWTCNVDNNNVTCTRPDAPFGNAPPLVLVVVPTYDQAQVVVTGTATASTPDPSTDNNSATTTVPNSNPVHPRLAGGGVSVGCSVAPARPSGAPAAPLAGLGLCVLALALRRRRQA